MRQIQKDFQSIVVNDDYYRDSRKQFSQQLRTRKRQMHVNKQRNLQIPAKLKIQIPSNTLSQTIPGLMDPQISSKVKLTNIFARLQEWQELDDIVVEKLYFIFEVIDVQEAEFIRAGFPWYILNRFLGKDIKADRNISLVWFKISTFPPNSLRNVPSEFLIQSLKYLLDSQDQCTHRIALFSVKNLLSYTTKDEDHSQMWGEIYLLAEQVVQQAPQIVPSGPIETQVALMKVFAKYLWTQNLSYASAIKIASITEIYFQNSLKDSSLDAGLTVLQQLTSDRRLTSTISEVLLRSIGINMFQNIPVNTITALRTVKNILEFGTSEQIEFLVRKDLLNALNRCIHETYNDIRLLSYKCLTQLVMHFKTIPDHPIISNITKGLSDRSISVIKATLDTFIACWLPEISSNTNFISQRLKSSLLSEIQTLLLQSDPELAFQAIDLWYVMFESMTENLYQEGMILFDQTQCKDAVVKLQFSPNSQLANRACEIIEKFGFN